MNTLLVFVLAVSTASASVIAGPAGITLKGPASGATVIGPDGSSISAAADSGAVSSSILSGAIVAAPQVIGSRAIIGAPGLIGAVNPWGLAAGGIVAPGINGWGRSVWW